MILNSKLAASFLTLACCAPSFATTLNFDYIADSSNAFAPVSGDFGKDMFIGDTANLVLKTAPNKAFQTAGDYISAILGFTQYGNRLAAYSYSFFLDGTEVYSGTHYENTSAIHIGPSINTGFHGFFDEYRWSATLESSSASGNTSESTPSIAGASFSRNSTAPSAASTGSFFATTLISTSASLIRWIGIGKPKSMVQTTAVNGARCTWALCYHTGMPSHRVG